MGGFDFSRGGNIYFTVRWIKITGKVLGSIGIIWFICLCLVL